MKRFSWDLGFYCNFQCEYCFFTAAGWEHLRRRQGEPRSPEIIEQAWRAIYDTYGPCSLYVSGGEPFLYPRLTDILERLSSYHKMQITTNLSQPIDDFLSRIAPSTVEINSTFHPFFIDAASFTDKVLRLREAGFSCSVCYLAYPGQMREMLNYKKFFSNHGVDMTLVVYWGSYQGRDYPENYTQEEKEYYRFVAQWKPGKAHGEKQECITGASARDGQAANLEPRPAGGNACGAGCDYANIEVDGSVRPCGQLSEPKLGNLYERTVRLFKDPFVCTADFCKVGERNYSGTGME